MGNEFNKKSERNSGKLPLRPRARILRTLGDELISSETVALIELVKNSYDADATRVLIRFTPPLQISEGSIEVIDNGHGMTLETIQTAWMEPATLIRKRNPRSEERRRRVLGEKGIGRFASSRLADYLKLITRRKGGPTETFVSFDWSLFDDEEKFLDEVNAIWETRMPTEICPGGGIEELWADHSFAPQEELNHGTILRMEGIRATWGREQFETLRSSLSRIVSPFFGQDIAQNDEFSIRLDLPDPFTDLSGLVEPPEALKKPHYLIKGDIGKDGHYKLTVKLKGQNKTEELINRFTFRDSHEPVCGPFKIELRVWDRDRDSLEELASLSKSTIASVRRDLDHAAGINIYRDGFRVLPYGEPYNDWLRLDLRSRLNPTLRLANNQIVGYVLISADTNPLLRDQSNREGLMQGPALDDLKELIKMVLAVLEPKRYDLRPRREKEKSRGGIFYGFNLNAVRDMVVDRYPADTSLLTVVNEKEKDLEERIDLVQEVLSRYHRLATLGQLIDTILHDGRTPVAKIKNESQLGIRDIERAPKTFPVLSKLRSRFDLTYSQSNVLSTLFRRIEPFGGRKRGRPARISLEKAIEDAFAVLGQEIKDIGVDVRLPKTVTEVTIDQAEIEEVIINLLQNSLYWLRKVPPSGRKIIVQVKRVNSQGVEILFADSGPGVDPEFQDRIFEPYFSTKPDGIGLGLAIAGDIITDYYGGDLDLVKPGLLAGAMFRIMLRKRV